MKAVWSSAVWLAVAVVLLLAASSWVVFAEFQRSAELRREVDRSYRVRGDLQRVLSLHQDVETGQRGYVITGDAQFLEPYQAGTRALPDALRRLMADVGRYQGYEGELAALNRLSAAKVSFSDAAISARRSAGAQAAASLIAAARGKAVMDAIRQVIGRLDSFEARRLEAATRQAEEAARRTQILVVTLQGMLGILLILAALVTSRTLRQRRKALAAAEDASARQRAVLENAKDGIITLNPSGSMETINPAAATMFGYLPEELTRRDVGVLFEVAPDRGSVETFLKRLQRNGRKGGIDEFWGRREDGRVFPCEVSVSAMTLASGAYYIAIVRDVTERKQVEELKSAFVSTVSHELRTPLTSVAGSLGLIAGGAAGELPERAKRLVDIALSNAKRLVRLINDILDIEKIESGAVPFDHRDIPLKAFLEQAVALNQAYADEHKAVLELGPVPDEAMVIGDSDRLMQVLTNLLSNACKFSPEGGAVRVSVRPLDRMWRISVLDQGSGIPDAFRERIFEKFAQADSSDTRTRGGTGLGLSIVREIVTRLGGAVSFESAEAVGTVFHVDVPARFQQRPQRASADGLPVILHVDDDPDVLSVVAAAFEGRAQVRAVTTVADGKTALQTGDIDLVLLDIGLADESGLDLLAHTDVPVVVFTAQDCAASVRSRVAAVLIKSRASLDDLLDTAESLLRSEGRE